MCYESKGDDKCSFRCNFMLIIFVSLYFRMKLCQQAGGIDSKQVHVPSALIGRTDFLLRFETLEPLGLGFGFFQFLLWVQQSYRNDVPIYIDRDIYIDIDLYIYIYM